jgi:hypothetical protein
MEPDQFGERCLRTVLDVNLKEVPVAHNR